MGIKTNKKDLWKIRNYLNGKTRKVAEDLNNELKKINAQEAVSYSIHFDFHRPEILLNFYTSRNHPSSSSLSYRDFNKIRQPIANLVAKVSEENHLFVKRNKMIPEIFSFQYDFSENSLNVPHYEQKNYQD